MRIPAAPVALLALLAAALPAQDRTHETPEDSVLQSEQYVRPPAHIAKLVTAPRHLNVTLSPANQSPTRRHFLRIVSDGLPSLESFGKPWYNLAGFQVDHRANRARTLTTRSGAGLEILDAGSGRATVVQVPEGARVSGASWSPDGSQVAFVANFADASHLYVADVASGRSRRLTTTPLLATWVTEPQWTAGGRQLVAVLLPDQRGAEPKAPAIAIGPKVRMTEAGREHRTRTYADLLEWPYEQDLVEYYSKGQLATIDAQSRAVKKIGAPAMIQRVDPSPSGAWFRVTTMQRPFSYVVPVNSFATIEELWDASGRPVAELARRELPRGESDDDDDAPAGRATGDTARRGIQWMPRGDTLYFLQMDAAPQSGGDEQAGQGAQGGQRTRARDRLYVWAAPFTAATRTAVLDNGNRMSQVAFSADGKTVFVAENVSGAAHVFAVDRSDAAKRYTLTRVRGLTPSLGIPGGGFGGGRGGNGADSLTFYQNPGTLVSERAGNGTPVILTTTDGRYAFLEGVQYYRAYNDSAPQPFLDRIEIRTGEKTRLFTSPRDRYERVIAALDAGFSQAVVSSESATDVEQYLRRNLSSGETARLTNNRDYSPEITNAQKQIIQVSRPDGYRFWVTVTTPADWKPGTRLPAIFWFYPREFTDQASYDRTRRNFNRNAFPNLGARSMVYLVTHGYAVVEPDAPIVGESGRMNDNYIHDLRNNLSAVIDELDRRGIIDRQRLGLGGHSYGAFSTVNAMVNTPFFKAGIAGDGNYNRTLTPNAFQSERRLLWDARETYLSMSPFLYADRLTGALLMYHNLEDQNVGTDPINSIRLFHALQGMGKPAALYMHPYEDHGPAAEETLLDLWGRWVAWLDKYVKQSPSGKIAN